VRAPRPSVAGLRRFAPSLRSVVVGLGLLAVAVGSYALLRQSSAFAITRIEVAGAPAPVRAQVRHAAAADLGTNLLALDGAALIRRIEALPTVVSARYDRAFPHSLHVAVLPETPVAVVHRGRGTWLVSARARVIARIPTGTEGALPRVWVPRATVVGLGGFLAPRGGATAVRTAALATRFPARIATIGFAHGEIVFRLHSGLELRLGAPVDVRLKLAIARRALAQLPAGATYVDVSVPGRPVAGTNTQLSGGA
jgi:cell division protein FtsQ